MLRQTGAARLDLNFRQVAVLRYALDHPGTRFSIKVHQDYHRTSYQTARTDLLGLAKQDLLIKGRVGREFVFFAPPNLVERLENPE